MRLLSAALPIALLAPLAACGPATGADPDYVLISVGGPDDLHGGDATLVIAPGEMRAGDHELAVSRLATRGRSARARTLALARFRAARLTRGAAGDRLVVHAPGRTSAGELDAGLRDARAAGFRDLVVIPAAAFEW